MKSITVIFSAHREQGCCTSKKLETIISKIKPDVIFEEIHPDRIDLYYKDKTQETLETRAISNYRLNCKTDHIPVDYYDINRIVESFKNINHMLNYIEDTNGKIIELMENRIRQVTLEGFVFLNSQECTILHKEIENQRKISVIQSNSKELLSTYKLWIEIIDSRENKMLMNIYSFCYESNIKKGLFIVGAEHRGTLIDKIKRLPKDIYNEINWNYENYDGIL